MHGAILERDDVNIPPAGARDCNRHDTCCLRVCVCVCLGMEVLNVRAVLTMNGALLLRPQERNYTSEGGRSCWQLGCSFNV